MKFFKNLIGIISISIFFACGDKQNVEALIFKNQIPYKSDNDFPYTGKVFKLDQEGKKVYDGYYLKGYKDGTFTYYDESGLVKEIQNFQNGVEEGKHLIYVSGELVFESNFQSGLLEGPSFQINHLTNNKVFEGKYKKGLAIGDHKYWFDNGKISSVIRFIESPGEPVLDLTNCKLFYPNGAKMMEFQTIDNTIPSFKMFEYYENGRLKRVKNIYYSNGVVNAWFIEGVTEGIGYTGSINLGSAVNFGPELEYNKSGEIINQIDHF